MKIKYPRTPHLPCSPGATSDDKMLTDYSNFEGYWVVITEKMDGENTTLATDYIHARSLDSNNHPSRNYVKGLWGNIAYQIPENVRICGENLYARHSIHYTDLEDYFLVFNTTFTYSDGTEVFESWNTIKIRCEKLNLKPVSVLYEGIFDIKVINDLIKNLPKGSEGFVVRNRDEFLYEDFNKNVAKYVRANHVQTDEHWMNQPIIKNELKK